MDAEQTGGYQRLYIRFGSLIQTLCGIQQHSVVFYPPEYRSKLCQRAPFQAT